MENVKIPLTIEKVAAIRYNSDTDEAHIYGQASIIPGYGVVVPVDMANKFVEDFPAQFELLDSGLLNEIATNIAIDIELDPADTFYWDKVCHNPFPIVVEEAPKKAKK